MQQIQRGFMSAIPSIPPYLFRHFIERVRERYDGLELTVGQCRHLANLFWTESGLELLQAEFRRNSAHEKTGALLQVWEISISCLKGFEENQRRILVLRDPVDGGFVTAYPPGTPFSDIPGPRANPNVRRIRKGRGRNYRLNRSKRIHWEDDA